MYQSSYAEVIEDDQQNARQIEYEALDHIVRLLKRAASVRSPSREGVEALHATRELWMMLINLLKDPDNAMSLELRAQLISIGIWILREAEAIRLGRSTNYDGIAEVCATVRDGLR